MNITIDQVTDNGDNSLTIIGHDDDGNEYTSGNGRLSVLPKKDSDKMNYYLETLLNSLPPENPVLYVTPSYTAKLQAITDADIAAEEQTKLYEDTEAGTQL